ncbi:hypothetical protein CDD82_1824 [Ophiocordyceps australis]|uniref:Oxysterol-binding protein n=1 Tax=Ophiocordyceps australis TaxID=1399860 RepID=A0A2C5Y846_9HYPO|nr:hypothetical protein CDD82_1824 [Ophiocordyceps australis]
MGLSGLVAVPGRRRASTAGSSRSSVDEVDDDTQVVEPDQGNVLSHIISQLRPGADLSRVVLPTFILEPRSMLERITNFMCHPEMVLHIPTIDDPVDRFVSVVKFYLSGWHIRPPGVKKPLNPILGEVFTCFWDLDGQHRAYYISEQTSHHPPKSSYFYMAPHYHIRIDGTLKPRSKFLGNSAASMMEGIAFLSLLNRGKNPDKGERYIITQPNMYARGILFGKMKYELGDHSFVRCPELDLVADVDFKTKGWVSGTYNAIGGVIKRESTGEVLFELSGLWSDEMFIRNVTTGQKEMFFDATRSKPTQPQVRSITDQDERESQKLWEKTARAVKERNHEVATDEKTKIEDRQREEASRRTQDAIEWHPRLFRRVRGGPGCAEEGEEDLEWIINATIDSSAPPEKQIEQILSIYPIIEGQTLSQHNTIPRRHAENDSSVAAPVVATTVAPPSTLDGQESLIDFGSDVTPAQSHQQQQQSDVIKDMLSTTGKQADGPLIDFAQEMKRDLPQSKDEL